MALDDIIQNIDDITTLECHDLNKLEECRNYCKSNNHENDFTLLTLNIRSYQRNFDDFAITLQRLGVNLDVIVLTECWLHEGSIIDNLPGYNVYRSDKQQNKNGGVVIYVKNKYDVSITSTSLLDTDSLLLVLNNKIALIGLYRSPSFSNLSDFIASIDNLLTTMNKYDTIIISGDTNIDICNTTNNKHHDYLCLMASHSLLPVITKPTRGKSCIDHIFIKSKPKPRGIICKSSITDHDIAIACLPNIDASRRKPNAWKYKINDDDLILDLANKDWSDVLTQQCPSTAATLLTTTLVDLIEKHTRKIKTPRSKLNIQPWITPGLMRCIKHRDRLHLSLRADPKNTSKKLIYTRYRNFCNDLLRKIKIEYDSRQLQENSKNPQTLWKVLKSIYDPSSTQKNKTSSVTPNCPDPIDCLNKYNTYFTTVGKNLADTILTRISETQTSLTNKYTPQKNLPLSFFIQPTDETEVSLFINQLKKDSSPGPDKIGAKLLKKIQKFIVAPLTYIINLSIETGVFPEQWKVAAVSPIHKGGPPDKPENYRPIALLSILSKILEKVVNTRLVNFLEKNNIISERQFGFRKGKSTEDAALLLTKSIANCIEKGDRCMAVFLDLAKAFDTISTDLLLKKLDASGIRGIPLDWFRSYLTNRSQYVKSECLTSSKLSINFGVPQGSLLGPTLFTIYINDILNLNIHSAELISYADDTVILFQAKTWEQLFSLAEEGLSTVAQTLNNNLLTLNIKKTKAITFFKTMTSSPPSNLSLKFHTCHTNTPTDSCSCEQIQRTHSIRYLGLIIDENLSYKEHIQSLSTRVRKLIYIMKKLRDRTSKDTQRMVYYAICQSIIQYGISIWGGAGKTTLIELERAQRAVIKVLLKKPFLYPTDTLFNEFGVLRVRQLYILNAYLHTFKQLKKRPDYQTLISKRTNQVPVPRTISLLARRCPTYLHTTIFNNVNRSISRSTNELPYFACKKVIKKLLMELTYEETENILTASSTLEKTH